MWAGVVVVFLQFSPPVCVWEFVTGKEGRSSRQVRSMGLWSLVHGGCVPERLVGNVAALLL